MHLYLCHKFQNEIELLRYNLLALLSLRKRKIEILSYHLRCQKQIYAAYAFLEQCAALNFAVQCTTLTAYGAFWPKCNTLQ